MIKIKTKNFPPDGYHAIIIWPFLFYKGTLTENDIKHENVHQRQYLVCVLVGLFIWVIKYLFIGTIWNIPFFILPWILFYILWFIGYKIKGYDKMNWEENAKNAEK